jgi:hypothetical protein
VNRITDNMLLYLKSNAITFFLITVTTLATLIDAAVLTLGQSTYKIRPESSHGLTTYVPHIWTHSTLNTYYETGRLPVQNVEKKWSQIHFDPFQVSVYECANRTAGYLDHVSAEIPDFVSEPAIVEWGCQNKDLKTLEDVKSMGNTDRACYDDGMQVEIFKWGTWIHSCWAEQAPSAYNTKALDLHDRLIKEHDHWVDVCNDKIHELWLQCFSAMEEVEMRERVKALEERQKADKKEEKKKHKKKKDPDSKPLSDVMADELSGHWNDNAKRDINITETFDGMAPPWKKWQKGFRMEILELKSSFMNESLGWREQVRTLDGLVKEYFEEAMLGNEPYSGFDWGWMNWPPKPAHELTLADLKPSEKDKGR